MPPRRDVDRLQGEIEELFRDLWQLPGFLGTRAGFRPPVDCFRTDDPAALTVVVELAGLDAESLRIDVADRELVVSGERQRPPGPVRHYQQMEIEYGAFERHVALSEPVDADAASAVYDAGLLTIVLPLAERPTSRERVTIVVVRGAQP